MIDLDIVEGLFKQNMNVFPFSEPYYHMIRSAAIEYSINAKRETLSYSTAPLVLKPFQRLINIISPTTPR